MTYDCEHKIRNTRIYSCANKVVSLDKTMQLLSYLLIGLFCLLVILLLNSQSLLESSIYILFGICLFIPILLIYIFNAKQKKFLTVQWQYVVKDGLFKVYQIYKRKKEIVKVPLDCIVQFGKYTSTNGQGKKNKKLNAFCNSDSQNLNFVLIDFLGKRTIILCELNFEMILTIKRQVLE
ncbi:MAG: hypothetical protein LBU60_00325 [Clostridiales bacterium]|jgi:uncharacterized membrane protein YuzA (DUF378 family)|nr:hypothetical protein [Clostridiales bacterium]